MRISARYYAIFIFVIGFLSLPVSSTFAADAKPLSDIQLDDSRMTDEAIVCRNLDKNDLKVGSKDGMFFVLKPKTQTTKKAFSLKSAENDGSGYDKVVDLSGGVVSKDAKKSSDIPFSPEVLEVSRQPGDTAENLGVACSFVGGPLFRKRVTRLTDAQEDGENGPGKIANRRGRRESLIGGGGPGGRIRYKLFNPCW